MLRRFVKGVSGLCNRLFTNRTSEALGKGIAESTKMYLREEQKCLMEPTPNCSTDYWGCRRKQVYNGGWATCRHSGVTELMAAIPDSNGNIVNPERLVTYRYNVPHYAGTHTLDHVAQDHATLGQSTGRQIAENIARFFHDFEERMGWWDRTHVHPTEHDDTVHVYYSGGWLQNTVSCWLGTLVCRLGGRYFPDKEFDWVFHQHSYGATTLPAIYRYLDGCTHYVGPSSGWYDVFRWRTWDEVCQMLIHPSAIDAKMKEIAATDSQSHPSQHRQQAIQSLHKGDPPYPMTTMPGSNVEQVDFLGMQQRYGHIQQEYYRYAA